MRSDGVEAAKRVREPAGADLEPGLAEDAAEGHDVARGVGQAPLRAWATSSARRLVAHDVDVLAHLQHRAERLLHDLGVDLLPAERSERVRPVDRLGDARGLRQVEPPQPAHERGRLRGEPLGHARHAQAHDLDLPLERRMPDPVEERAPLERVVQLARAVRGQDDGRALARRDRAELGDRDLEVGEHLEEERLELLVRAVDLVDQEHDRLVGVDRLQQRPPDQELGPEELVLRDSPLLRGADMEQLARVVPLVDGVG